MVTERKNRKKYFSGVFGHHFYELGLTNSGTVKAQSPSPMVLPTCEGLPGAV